MGDSAGGTSKVARCAPGTKTDRRSGCKYWCIQCWTTIMRQSRTASLDPWGVVTRTDMAWFHSHYVSHPDELDLPYVSPLRSGISQISQRALIILRSRSVARRRTALRASATRGRRPGRSKGLSWNGAWLLAIGWRDSSGAHGDRGRRECLLGLHSDLPDSHDSPAPGLNASLPGRATRRKGEASRRGAVSTCPARCRDPWYGDGIRLAGAHGRAGCSRRRSSMARLSRPTSTSTTPPARRRSGTSSTRSSASCPTTRASIAAPASSRASAPRRTTRRTTSSRGSSAPITRTQHGHLRQEHDRSDQQARLPLPADAATAWCSRRRWSITRTICHGAAARRWCGRGSRPTAGSTKTTWTGCSRPTASASRWSP